MANSLVVQDAYPVINELYKMTTGRENLKAIDTSSFVAVGETMLRTGVEPTLKALSQWCGKTYFEMEKYRSGVFRSIIEDNERWGAITREIITLSNDAEPSQDWNTNLNENQLADGQSVDMYKINAPKAVELKFYGSKVLQSHITRFRDQLALAFSNEAEFLMFVTSYMTAYYNDIESRNEAKRRLTVLNFMAGISSIGTNEVDLVNAYNTEYGTEFTRKQLLSPEHHKDFMAFVVSRVKKDSKKMQDRTTKYHMNLTGKDILRFTRPENQKLLMYTDFWVDSETQVLPEVFNDNYLKIADMELVNGWQEFDSPAINITPNIIDADGVSKTATKAVSLPYVLGLLYDRRAMGVNNQWMYSAATPFNAAGGYYNIYDHYRFNAWNNFTHNAILYVLGEGV
nr:MAG TPA: major capsid protein [Caudoviricetes sp.]